MYTEQLLLTGFFSGESKQETEGLLSSSLINVRDGCHSDSNPLANSNPSLSHSQSSPLSISLSLAHFFVRTPILIKQFKF